MTERREQRAARELKENFTPYWERGLDDDYRLESGFLFVDGRFDGATNSVVVKIKLFQDSEDALAETCFESPNDYSVDVRAMANEWAQKQLAKFIAGIFIHDGKI